jgi:threonine synthase
MQALAKDGGLYVPEHFPDLTALMKCGAGVSFREITKHVIRMFAPEFEPSAIDRIVRATYTKERFGDERITPIEWLDETTAILRLSGGPTNSFKDVALQLVVRLMSYELARQGKRLTLIVATSGDTGSAAAEAVRGLPNIDLYVLIPAGRITEFQRRQMTTIGADNVTIIAVDAPFDALQAMVKILLNDPEFVARHRISGVNSINWGRIMAQTAYWISAFMQVKERHPDADHITAAVPTGNFGDVYSAYVARQCGFPIDLLVCTNSNNVLDELFQTGVYRPRGDREVVQTTSPSMDIQVASNAERMFFDAVERDPSRLAALMDELKTKGQITLDPRKLHAMGFTSGSATEEDVMLAMRGCHEEWDRLVDPHTAVAMSVVNEKMPEGIVVVAETALPVKFADAVSRATGVTPALSAAQQQMMRARERVVTLARADAGLLKQFIASNSRVDA